MFGKEWRLSKEGFLHRREAINELHFIYKRLVRLLPALLRRAPEPRLAHVLKEQHELDVENLDGLKQVAMDMGQPPGPCLCDEADQLVEQVYHADRAGSSPQARTWGIVRALRAVRVYLIRTWGRLLEGLGAKDQEPYREQVVHLQHTDAAQHRQLTELTNELEGKKNEHKRNGSDGGRRSA